MAARLPFIRRSLEPRFEIILSRESEWSLKAGVPSPTRRFPARAHGTIRSPEHGLRTTDQLRLFYLTLPGTTIRDYSQPGLKIETQGRSVVAYPTLPGTSIRDYSQPGARLESDGRTATVYPTLPGTTIRDYSQPGVRVESQGRSAVAYPTLPGTSTRDYSKPGARTENDGPTSTILFDTAGHDHPRLFTARAQD